MRLYAGLRQDPLAYSAPNPRPPCCIKGRGIKGRMGRAEKRRDGRGIEVREMGGEE